MYADLMTDSMKEAIAETDRRRAIQQAYNEKYGIVPTTIIKEIRPPLHNSEDEIKALVNSDGKSSRSQIEAQIKSLEKQMREAAKAFDFERAAELRDIILEAKANLNS